MTAPVVSFFWDFHGPRAEGTARHFARHLEELFARESIAGCATAVEEAARNHWVVRCDAPAARAEALRAALRPRRESAAAGE